MPYLIEEFDICFNWIDEILDDLQDIKLALELGEDLSSLLYFDPFKTIGKYV